MILHPLTKILIVICLSSYSLISGETYLLLVILLISVFLNLFVINVMSHLKKLVNLLKKVIPLFLGIFIIQIIFNRHGRVLVKIPFLSITEIGLINAVRVVLRLLVIIFSGAWLWLLTPRQFSLAMKKVGLPDSISVMVIFTLRFLPIFIQKTKNSSMLIKVRGIRFNMLSFRDRINLFSDIVITNLGWNMKDIKYQAIALDMRGFRNGLKHTCFNKSSLAIQDYASLFLIAFLLALKLFLR